MQLTIDPNISLTLENSNSSFSVKTVSHFSRVISKMITKMATARERREIQVSDSMVTCSGCRAQASKKHPMLMTNRLSTVSLMKLQELELQISKALRN